MGAILCLLLLFIAIEYLVLRIHVRRDRRRDRLRNLPFPEAWRVSLQKNMRLYGGLSETFRRELEGHIQVFLFEKNFEGCAGLKVTDEMRVLIAAHACLLLLNRKTDCYPNLHSIVIYPTKFDACRWSGDGETDGTPMFRLGESWETGAVVVSWDHVRSGNPEVPAGRNLVLHEFAHQIDQENGLADGIPILERRSSYANWLTVLRSEQEKLARRLASGASTFLDRYAAIDDAEFFAVATERFFGDPAEFFRQSPELYEEFRKFYKQDPRSYLEIGFERG